MKDIVKLGGLLMLISTVAATALAGVYLVTKPKIEFQKQLILTESLTSVLPGAAVEAIFPVTQGDAVKYYEGYTSSEKTSLVGYAFVSSGRGYSSNIVTMVGVDTVGAIIGIRILSQVETPGLGTRVEEVKYGESDCWFQRQFLRKIADVINVDKDGGDIQSITGATISSRAVTRSIVSGYKELKAELGTQQQ